MLSKKLPFYFFFTSHVLIKYVSRATHAWAAVLTHAQAGTEEAQGTQWVTWRVTLSSTSTVHTDKQRQAECEAAALCGAGIFSSHWTL